MTHHVQLDTIVLAEGAHDSRDDGMCLLEAVAYFADEPHSDRPTCVSSVIAAFGRRWNDDLDHETRQRLKPYIARMVGTNTGKADDEIRAWMVTDWMVRTYLPAWLELGGMTDQAAAVRALDPLTSASAWQTAKPVVGEARQKAAAAWDAARAAAWAAAGDAARDAAWAAAWAAARAAAWDAARAAAWDAAGAAAGDAAWDAAGDAARDAAGDAAGDAARDALRPTTLSLQESAFGLLDRLIAVGSEVPA